MRTFVRVGNPQVGTLHPGLPVELKALLWSNFWWLSPSLRFWPHCSYRRCREPSQAVGLGVGPLWAANAEGHTFAARCNDQLLPSNRQSRTRDLALSVSLVPGTRRWRRASELQLQRRRHHHTRTGQLGTGPWRQVGGYTAQLEHRACLR